MADPHVEAGQPSPMQGIAPINLSICFNKHPNADEVFGTVEGTNFRRLLQAQQDEDLKIFHRPPPENPRRPQNLYDILPASQRRLLTQATYIWDDKKENRLQVWIVVTDSLKHFFKPQTKRTGKSPPSHDHRALFKIGSPEIDARTLQFLQNAICNICERLPSHNLVPSEETQSAPFLLGNLDERTKDFILRVARRHAGIPLKPPQIRLSPSTGGRPPAIETTVPVMYRSATDQTTKVSMQVIELELRRIPPHEDFQNHAFGLLAWISTHTMDRVFVPGSLESYVDYLKGLACLGSRIDREVSGHGGLYGGMDLFTIGVADAGYTISPSAAAVSHISSGRLPKICVVANRNALLRAIERLETVYLATGKIESAWKECARRSDFETECIQEGEPLPPTRCTCTFAERANTVHLCNRCNKSLLCGDNAMGHGPLVEIICASCADQERQEHPKCHPCHMQSKFCHRTSNTDRCDHCIKNGLACNPIRLTDSGNLPETYHQQEMSRQARGETKEIRQQQRQEQKEARQQQQQEQKEAQQRQRQEQKEAQQRQQQERKEAQQQEQKEARQRQQQEQKETRQRQQQEQKEARLEQKESRRLEQKESRRLKEKRSRLQKQQEYRQQEQSPKCHRCYMYGKKCHYTDDSEQCDVCIKSKTSCGPVQLTDNGELPETYYQQKQHAARCHWCFMRNLICHYSNDSEQCDRCVQDQKPCIPIKLTETGDLPKTYNQRRSGPKEPGQRPAPKESRKRRPRRSQAKTRLESNWQKSMRLDVDAAFEGQDTSAQGLLGSKHWPEYWQQIEKHWSSGKGWPDVYQRIDRAFDQLGRPLLNGQLEDTLEPGTSGNAGRRMYGPFGMELDALNPAYPFHDSIVNHAPGNVVPTSSFINSLRHVYAPLILPMVALLCRQPGRAEMDRISQKVDHIFLIALQFEREKKKRMKLLTDEQRISAINRQHTNGVAEPEACLLIDHPWSVAGTRDFTDRYHTAKRRSSTVVVDVARVEAFIAEIETHFDQKLPRAAGDASAVYLFHPANRPVQWDWYSVRMFYSFRLAIMTRWCNRHHDTDCTVESLFALHCLQYMQAQHDTDMPWLLLLLQPYTRHPFQASAGHIAHGIEMSTGFVEENISLAAFSETECNITYEPFVWNFMKNLYDDLVPRMVHKLRAMPLHNPPYWSEELVRAHAPDLPATKWGGAGKSKSKKGKSKKSKSKKGKSKKDKSKKGESTSNRPTTSETRPKKPKTTQLGDDTSRFLRSRKSLTTSPVGHPNRGNLTNRNNICYASAVVQVTSNVPALRALVNNIEDLPFSYETGRGLGGFLDLKDPGFVKYREVVAQLSTACTILESTDSRVGAHIVLDLMSTLRKIDAQFVLNEECDASMFFNRIVTILNAVGDTSKVLPDTDSERPHTKLRLAQDQRILDGELLRPLPEELADQRAAHRAFGNDSDADRATNIECVEESTCTFPGCQSPHSRSFHNLGTMRVTFPVGEVGYSVDRAYDINELIQLWAHKEGRSTCDYNKAHGEREEAVKKIVGTPEVLVVHVDRLALASDERQPRQDLDEIVGFMKNPLIVHQVIDLREQCERELPTEAMLETRLKTPPTKYRLRAVLRYTHHHFLTYALTPDEKNTLHWAKFDDLRGRVDWEDPIQPASEQTENTFDFMLFYERMGVDEKPAATAEGKGVTKHGDAATKAIDISSAEEDSDEEGSEMDISGDEKEASEYAGSSDKEDSDDTEDSDKDEDFELDEDHDAEEEFEALQEDFGYEVEYEGLPYALTAESASDSESSDGGSDISSEYEDFDRDLPEPNFDDLTLEAQAQEISIVFQQAAEPESVTDDVKEKLRANSKQVLIVGSMLSKALRQQVQGGEYESSGGSSDEFSTTSDVEMGDQSTADSLPLDSEHMLKVFKSLPAYTKGICLAQGTLGASDLLAVDQQHHDLLRKLHLYTGRAIMMCKELHEVDSAPEDGDPEVFKTLPTLRGRDMGLQLGSYYRSLAIYLYKQPDPQTSGLCNAYLCSSYVTEMGWQLDDLQAAQADHESKVAELENRNKALGAQVAELQAQLQDLKVAKTGDLKGAEPAVKPDVSTLSALDLFEHLQSVVQESRKFMLPDQGAPQRGDQTKSDEMEVDIPATSDISGSGKPPEKQDIPMSEDLPTDSATSGVPGSEQEAPKEKQDLPTTEDPPVHSAASGIPGSEQETPKEKGKQDATVSGLSPQEGDDMQPKLDTGKPKIGQKTAKSSKPSSSLFKPPGSPSKGSSKQLKGGIPNFMSTTAAAAAKSRPPVSKLDIKSDTAPPARAPTRGETRAGHRPKTRAATQAATRAGVSAEEQTLARPVTPTRLPATSLPAPATREEVHTGGRRRLGHRPDVSPPSPSATPSKKLRPHEFDEEVPGGSDGEAPHKSDEDVFS